MLKCLRDVEAVVILESGNEISSIKEQTEEPNLWIKLLNPNLQMWLVPITNHVHSLPLNCRTEENNLESHNVFNIRKSNDNAPNNLWRATYLKCEASKIEVRKINNMNPMTWSSNAKNLIGRSKISVISHLQNSLHLQNIANPNSRNHKIWFGCKHKWDILW